MKAKWVLALLAGILIGLLPALAAVAAPLSSPAMDGDGLMAVQPASTTYGTSATFVFTFTANNDFSSGSQVALTIPAGWTAPTTASGAGHVSVSSGASCTFSGSPGWQIDGPTRTILVDLASCLTNSSFTINYNGAPPGVTGSPFTFTTQTDIGPGGSGLVNINAGSPFITIDPKPVVVSGGLVPTGKVYDGTTAAGLTIGSPTLVGVIGTDIVALDTSLASAAFVDKNAGSSKAVVISGLALTGAQAGNYIISPPARSANITPSPITVTAVPDSKVYDGTASSSGLPAITSGSIQTGDVQPAWTQAFNNRNAGTGKTLIPAGLVNDGHGGANYSYTYATATGSITKYPLMITAASATKTYDRTVSSGGHPAITSGSVQAGDSEPAWTQTYNTAAAGTGKTLTPAGVVIDGNSGKNYAYTYVTDATGVILPKPLTVSATGLTPNNKVYDGTTNATGVTGSPGLVGVISGDTVTLGASGAAYAFVDKHAGTGKAVQVTGLTLGGAQAGNYALTQPNRTATIAKRPITITAVTDLRTYDGTNHSTGLPALTSGAIQPGDIAPVWTQTFNNKNAGTGKVLTPAGSVVDGNGGRNYAYTFAPNTTGVITKLAITVTAISDTKVYDGTTHSADIPNYAPALAGSDTAGFTQSFDTKNVGTGKTLTAAGLVNDGNGGKNYVYQFVPATAGVITVRSITVTAVTDTRAYDGTTVSGAAPSIAPWPFGTDTSGFAQSFDTKDAGTAKTLTPSGVVNDGNGSANYTITFLTDTTGSITPKPITVTANAQAKAQGALDPALTYTVNPALLGGDALTGSLTRATGESYAVYAISQGTLSAGSNYAITFVGANLLIGPAISGSAGVAGATLSYTDGTPKTATADGIGNYSLIVTSGWTGTVTPRKAGYAFIPGSTTYGTAVTSDVPGQNYTAHVLVTVPFASSGAQDGWVLESSQTSNIGGSWNAAAGLFNLGDDAGNRQYRSILSFNTSLPPTAVITSATLKFKPAGKVGANPFSISGNTILVDARKGAFSNNSALQITDFQAPASGNAVLSYTSRLVSGWYSKNLSAGNLKYINPAGVTQLRLRFTKGDNNNNVADYLTFYSGNYATASYRPTLLITYYLP